MTPEATSDTGRIVDYQLVCGTENVDLSHRIRQMILKGWQPFGPVTIQTGRDGHTLRVGDMSTNQIVYQPMVKYAPHVGATAIRKYTEEMRKSTKEQT